LLVYEVLEFIEQYKHEWDTSELAIAQKVLDMMNSAASNGYVMFMPAP